MSTITLSPSAKEAAVTLAPAAPTKRRKRSEPDPLTLATMMIEAKRDARTTLAADPHLKRMMKQLAECDIQEAEQTAREVDGYVAEVIAKYLSNPYRKPRVRFPKVDVMSTTDLKAKEARCIVRVKAYGVTQRFTLDFKLP
jgi:hypothetical protein